ncbi:MAG: cation:proton antiporter [Candidatus Dechloromonas phosphoritropha]
MDAGNSIDIAKHVLVEFGEILAIGTLCAFLAQKIKVPDVVTFLLAGMLMGPEVAGHLLGTDTIGVINIKADSALNQLILIFGSCYILFDGGATLRLKVLKEVWITILVMSTLGVLITTFATGLVAHYVLGVPLIVALLLAATIASTDPATLVPVFKQVNIKAKVAQTVMSESAFNDAMGAIITLTILGIAMGQGEFSLADAAVKLIKESVLGILAGGVLGYLAAWLIAHEKFDYLAEYAPVVSLMAVIGAYLSADGMHASGFMGVFVFGIMLGNKEIFGFRMEDEEEELLEHFILTTAFIMRMFIFILLGSQVDFALMNKYLVSGVIIVTFFMLVARPLTVFLCAAPDRRAKWTLNELLFMCWTRETGVIPAALAGILVGLKAPMADMIASVTFIAVLMTIIIQATTTKWLGDRLGLLER